jgi:predicted AAA+ superfamily ATPase
MPQFIDRALESWAGPRQRVPSDPMIFLTGPRQVGKTVLARRWSNAYFNWDTPEVKRARIANPFFFRTPEAPWVVFDEIHKRRDWKKILKGLYDSPDRRENFIVTGSGRFEQYQRGGDSVQGRYDLFQLWPLTVDEIAPPRSPAPAAPRDFRGWQPPGTPVDDSPLLALGGFPSPFLSGARAKLRRWQDQYLDRLVREDVRDFSAVHRLDQMELLARLLPARVSSPISMLSLAQDVEASPVGVKGWLRLFETLYLGFRVLPWHRHIHRAVKREPKWYFYQWTFVEDAGARFENYLAVQLGAALRAWTEQGEGRWELFYLRDQDRREVDFVVTRDLQPMALIEAKSSPQPWPSALHHYVQKLGVPGFLVTPEGPNRREGKLGFSVSSGRFLKGLTLA